MSTDMKKDSKIFVAGAGGMVGSAIVRRLKKEGYENLLVPVHDELELTDKDAVYGFFEEKRPDFVFDAAAKVGGIKANNGQMADFLMENMEIQNNLIRACHDFHVRKMLFLASSCIYPKSCSQPIQEDALLTGELEPTNEGYALAKIVGIKACQYYYRQYGDCFIAAMPANTYGVNDGFDLDNSHVIPALIRRFDSARNAGMSEVEMWGTGMALREFLYVDDLADACLFLMENYSDERFINIGSGLEVSMRELAEIVKRIVGYDGEIKFDATKPDGMMRRIVDSGRIHKMGWTASTCLEDGIRMEYEWYTGNAKE